MSNSNNTLSFFSRDTSICEDGTLTVIFAIVVSMIVFLARLFLHRGTNKKATPEDTSRKDAKPVLVGITKQQHWLEQMLVVPFVPSSLESYIAAIYFAWFIMTIPMAITRYYEKRWAHQLLAQQGPFNILAHYLGCKGLEITAINYTQPIPCPDENSSNGQRRFGSLLGGTRPIETGACDPEYNNKVDFHFSRHLAVGICWLTLGALQIFWARSGWSHNTEVRHKAHRIFGGIALIAFFGHIYMASTLAWHNPVQQVPMITAQYWATIIESVLLVCLGIAYRRLNTERGTAMHMVRMFFAFVQSVFGSGAVRLTAWILWLVGKFFAYPTRILIDRGECQTNAIPMGSAEHCWKPVFLNLALTDALILWLEWIFLCLDIANFDKADKAAIIGKFKHLSILLGIFILLVAFDAPDGPTQWLILIWAGSVRLSSIRMLIAGFAADRNLMNEAGDTLVWAQRLAKRGLLTVYVIPYGEEDHPHQD